LDENFNENDRLFLERLYGRRVLENHEPRKKERAKNWRSRNERRIPDATHPWAFPFYSVGLQIFVVPDYRKKSAEGAMIILER